eukprot:CCRYP_001851-RD/>CCRYP_001851-RD protein AED:0.02 eAED:0.02 QI:3275/0.75/0.8/1/0.75/0.4/5/484/532
MMQPSPPSSLQITRPITIYENERLWIGRGFSKSGLFPTERGPYSTHDGSLSWKTLREACLALLRYEGGKSGSRAEQGGANFRSGWSYHESGGDVSDGDKDDDYECRTEGGVANHDEIDYCGFVPCTGAEDEPTDEDGWAYYADFSPQSLQTPSRNRGMLDFVRRRKLRRIAYFRPDHFLPKDVYIKCDFCDSKAQTMLDALSLATLFLTGTTNSDCNDAKALPLKAKLIQFLNIGSNCKHDVLLYDKNDHYNTMTDIYRIKDRLSTFADTTVGRPGALAHLFHPEVGDSMIKAMPGRKEMISKNYFPEEERMAYAKLLVKDVDRYAFHLHCHDESCAGNVSGKQSEDNTEAQQSSACEFRLVVCPNLNCNERLSFKYQIYHDEECGFKPLPCTSGCGMEIPRSEMSIHVSEKCVLRPAECPLACIGCTTVVKAQDVSRHLKESSDQHFLFVANRMMECQALIKKLNGRIQMLEERNAHLELEIRGRTAQVSMKKDTDNLLNEVKKLTKRISALEGTCRTEFKKVEQERKHKR